MTSSAKGFTTAELLVTLFVAAMFFMAGTQLYNAVIKDGGDSRAESKASNVAYEYLRRYSDSAPSPCAASSPLQAQPIHVDTLTDVNATVSYSCPNQDIASLTKVDVTIKYSMPQKEVSYATFVDASSGATSENIGVADGLAAHWKMNGNVKNEFGNTQEVLSGVESVPNRDGQLDRALKFNGSSSYAYSDVGSMSTLTNQFSISWWANIESSGTVQTMFSDQSGTSGFYARVNNTSATSDGCNASRVCFSVRVGSSTRVVSYSRTLGAWAHYVAVSDGSILRLYVDGTSRSISSSAGTVTQSGLGRLCVGSGNGTTACGVSGFYAGMMDDLRVYNRALTSSEVSQIRTAGPR